MNWIIKLKESLLRKLKDMALESYQPNPKPLIFTKEQKTRLRSRLYRQYAWAIDNASDDFMPKDENKKRVWPEKGSELENQLKEALRIVGPISDEAMEKVCVELGHEVIYDQCGMENHQFCVMCRKGIEDIIKDGDYWDKDDFDGELED